VKLALLNENRSRVLENRVMRRKCGPKRDDVKGYRRILNSEKSHAPESILSYYGDHIKEDEISGIRLYLKLERRKEDTNVKHQA
jgi:hypothetical protein